jgi:chromosome partitioning protein
VKIAITNTKGGVGKTTTAVELAAGLARSGRRTVLADMDPAGAASWALGVAEEGAFSIGHAVLDGVGLDQVIRPTYLDLLRVLPGSERVADIGPSTPLGSLEGVLEGLSADTDVIVIDSPPTLSPAFLMALLTADAALLVTSAHPHGARGLWGFLRELARLDGEYEEAVPKRLGVLLTHYDTRSRVSSDVEVEMRSQMGSLILETVVRLDVQVQRAPEYGRALWDLDPTSRAAIDYSKVLDEVVARARQEGLIS